MYAFRLLSYTRNIQRVSCIFSMPVMPAIFFFHLVGWPSPCDYISRDRSPSRGVSAFISRLRSAPARLTSAQYCSVPPKRSAPRSFVHQGEFAVNRKSGEQHQRQLFAHGSRQTAVVRTRARAIGCAMYTAPAFHTNFHRARTRKGRAHRQYFRCDEYRLSNYLSASHT